VPLFFGQRKKANQASGFVQLARRPDSRGPARVTRRRRGARIRRLSAARSRRDPRGHLYSRPCVSAPTNAEPTTRDPVP